MEKVIVLEVAKQDVSFKVTPEIYTAYVNEVMPDDKVSASYALCKNAVFPKDREYFESKLYPPLAMTISGMLIKEYQGEVEVKIKK